jgi:hypothetical protein
VIFLFLTLDYYIRSLRFRYLIEEGKAGSPKMMTVGLHCRLAQPGRTNGLAEFIDYAKKYHKDVWFCTREEIADFWYENHYPVGEGSPMKSEREAAEEREENAEELTVEPLNIDEAEAKIEAAAVEEEEDQGDII